MFHFAANLKPYTFAERPSSERFDAYLLSADYASAHLELAAKVRREGRILVADNGNVDLMREFLGRFRQKASRLTESRRAHEETLGRYARPGELPGALRAALSDLAMKIAAASQATVTEAHARHALERQAAMGPDFLIGMEDLTLATLTGLSIEPEYLELPASFYGARTQVAVDWATRIEAGALGDPRGHVLVGLHALDYDTAVLAGSMAAEAGLEGVSLGFMGAMTDRNYVDFRVEQGQLIELPRPIPRSYLRVVEITAGLIEGYRQAGKPRPALHALGVGTPMLVPLLGLLSGGEPYLAMDSTSPIVDGWSSPTISLYVDEPAPFKYKAYKIADAWIRGERGWDCQCFDCEAFHAAHPPRVAEARRWWERAGRPKLRKEMLERDGALSTFLPFLAYPADDALRREASLARVGHNHGVLRRLERAVRDRADDPQALDRWVGALVDQYRSASRSPAWAAAVETAYRLARRVALTAASKERRQ